MLPSLSQKLLVTVATSTCVIASAYALPVATNPAPVAPAHAQDAIDWRRGDVDAAFAEARAANKPLFLYWGAVWCPPCNQVKATIFNRAEFIERSKQFIPVFIDGDSPQAQKLGARFKVSGYPTMILFNSQGEEITRLPGEVDARQYSEVLDSGLNGGRPASKVLAQARSNPASLSPGDWRLLSYYSWETDEQQLVAKTDLTATLLALSAACATSVPEASTRLALAAYANDAKNGAKDHAASAVARPKELALVEHVLSDPALTRGNFDILTDYPAEITAHVSATGTPERAALLDQWNQTLGRLAADPHLSTLDRLAAMSSSIALAHLDHGGKLPAPLIKEVKDQAHWADHATAPGYEREAVISGAAGNLAEAGLLDESDVMLKAELKRSHAPYYFMLELAANAKRRGNKAEAVGWYEKAFAAAQGPATRVQWGATLVRALVELTPDDETRIAGAAQKVIGDLGATSDPFYGRNGSAVTKLGKRLSQWNGDDRHAKVIAKLRQQMAGVCARPDLDLPQHASCSDFLAPEKNSAT